MGVERGVRKRLVWRGQSGHKKIWGWQESMTLSLSLCSMRCLSIRHIFSFFFQKSNLLFSSLQFAVKVVDFPALVVFFADFKITADTLEANLMREIEVMKRLRHRNIVRLEDSFWVHTELYMCMELIEGKNLLRTIPQGGMKEEEAKGLFFQLCSAVAYCHTNNVRCFFLFFD